MASKLDQSLDSIIGERPQAGRGRTRRLRNTRAAPVGGVKKAAATAKGAVAKAAAKITGKGVKKNEPAPAAGGATKVIVSNLPTDVNEAQIKEYFQQVAGPVKRVYLTYGPSGTSRGIATIIFNNAAAGAKAMEQKGTKVDGRSIRVEAVLNEAAPIAPAKTLRERATAPNAQPKKATAAPKIADKGKAGTARANAATRGGRRGRTAGRPKKKTAEELDAEMTDYFGTQGGGAATGGAAPAAATAAPAAAAGGEDMGMDEIS